ncbi:uncharacterized protein B0I36DRAFT_387683 [Microdochium trichocladiopsis]|uniref:Zn(2)-C6 fungal-type domain-containing protein n=1 Tax=Microdochium trichocladiopsis TaxID=1682393 RepID=A0A9P9BKQ6_9PEZI|nr:uncharacterized protein B0I36DRAFT_387683 [Microdochium trichocladiopsis]KAH7020847.1 hypothetical protein B0I36DRAFT_387683 [Microdochium trichocladiopsis]
MAEARADRKKAPTRRARTGCVPCRRAHRKCDECKPVCQRCVQLKLACSYPQTKHALAGGLGRAVVRPLAPAIRPSMLVAALLDPSSTLYFDYFKYVVVSQLGTQADDPTGFWSATVLCECVRDPPALDAVISIGALSRAGREVLDHASGPRGEIGPVSSSTHYAPAIQYYTKAIATFRQRIDQPGSDKTVPPRTLLVYTILFSIFETLHGNTTAFDYLVANGLRSLHMLRRRRRVLEGADVYDDAECFLTRTATWNAIYSPMYPQTRRVLASIASEGELLLLGPAPPDSRSVSVKGFWRTWWQFVTRAVLWHLRVQSFLDRVEERRRRRRGRRQDMGARGDGDADDDDEHDDNNNSTNSKRRAGLEDPAAEAATLAQLQEEQRLLVSRSNLWISSTQARLDDATERAAAATTTKAKRGNRAAYQAEVEASRRILTNMMFGLKVCHLAHCRALDQSETAWSTQACLDECGAALDLAQDLVAELTAARASTSSGGSQGSIMSDGLLIGLLHLARDCRDSGVRWRAFALAQQLVLRPSTRHVKSFVLGTWACLQAEERGRERGRDGGTGRIPRSHWYDWTGASWDEAGALHVTITTKEPDPASGVKRQESLVLERRDLEVLPQYGGNFTVC